VPSGDAEHLWIAVNTWRGDRIRGQIANHPQDCPELRPGQTVELRERDVYDWILIAPDGMVGGSYTNRVVQRDGER
jgi:uncharacterized protein YegJ (DUF2314 family)